MGAPNQLTMCAVRNSLLTEFATFLSDAASLPVIMRIVTRACSCFQKRAAQFNLPLREKRLILGLPGADRRILVRELLMIQTVGFEDMIATELLLSNTKAQ